MSAATSTAAITSPSTVSKSLAGSVSSSDGIASTSKVSPAASVNGDAASVDSAFGATRQTSLVAESPCGSDPLALSTRTTDTASAVSQRSQRLLVRVPSTGAVVVIPASALAFGRHKQRGKPLILCAAFDGAQDASTAVCPDPANCRHVHADLRLSTPFHPHRRSAALLGQYPRMPAGTIESVLSADGSTVERIPTERMLLTRALQGTRRPIPQCEHFLKSACNRGSECEFAHVVGSTPSPPQQQQRPEAPAKSKVSAVAVAVPTNAPRNSKQASAQLSQPLLPPQAFQPYPHRYDRGPCPHQHHQEPSRAAPAFGARGGHAMPHWSPSMPMPSASAVLSSAWAAPTAPSAAAVLRY